MNTMIHSLHQIDSNLLQFIIDTVKMFKTSDIFIVINDILYCTSTDGAYIERYELPFSIPIPVCMPYKLDDMDIGLSFVTNKNLYKVEYDNYYNLYIWITGEERPIIVNNIVIPPTILNIINNCEFIRNSIPDRSFDSIIQDDTIIRMNSMLSTEGSVMYRKDGYIMTLYKGLFPLNKSDDLHLKVYNEYNKDMNITFFTSLFTVYKKKKGIIEVFLKFRYI